MLVLLGLPLDCWLRTRRATTAFTWMLLPFFLGWATDQLVKAVGDPRTLLYVPALDGPPPLVLTLAPLVGLGLGLAGCAAIEFLENRTGQTPTARPMQVLGLILGVWLARSVVDSHLPDDWKHGRFVPPLMGLCLAWLLVRALRAALNANPTRKAILARATRGRPASPDA